MVRRIRPFLLFVSLAFSLTACQQSPPDTSPLPGASPPAANPPTLTDSGKPATGSAGLISVAPGSMMSCDPAVEATVKWDLHGAHPDTTTVDVYVDDGHKIQLFTEGGITGQTKTGLWTHPGTVFILKNKANNEALDEVRVSGPSCKVDS